MKKWIAILLVLTLSFSLVACGKAGANNNGAEENVPADALELLTNIWNGIPEDKRFFAMGGDMTNLVEGGPGKYLLEDEGLTATLLVPAEQIAKLDQAASLVHGMMVNNFTAGAYHVKDGEDANAFADAMQASITQNQWVCGMPEHFTVAVIGGQYVLAYFGINDVIEAFAASLKTVYPNADIKYDEAIRMRG